MTTSNLRDAAQQALEALGKWSSGRDMDAVQLNDLIAMLEAALEQPEQETRNVRTSEALCPEQVRAQPEQEPVAYLYHLDRFAKLVYEKAWADTALAATHTVTDAAIAKEREACAKVCDKLWNAAECAEAIRARSNNT